MAPYLAPVERPKGFILKMLYRILRRQFGTVPSWLSVFSARMPLAFSRWMGKVQAQQEARASSGHRGVVRAHVDSLSTAQITTA